ncbi:MAG: 5'-3' exonuclease H3TH domain-containing protein, partial [Acidobacteriota bacterium]
MREVRTGGAMEDKRLYLIDGNSLLYRSYYAIRRLSNSRGFPTNAIFGFIAALRKIIDQEKPDYLGVVFDVKGPTVRHEAYKDYKAHLKPMPDDLVVQVPVLKDVLHALNIPTAEFEKYEADDVLATLARQAAGKHIRSVIVTTDKDLLQIIDASTSVYNPARETIIDEAGVKEVFGVGPDQVVDVLSLWGDPTDNVPGVPGVGEKTAKSLIQEFGSLDNLLQNLERIKNPRIKEKIGQNLELLALSRRLVTVERDVAVSLDLDAYALGEPNRDETLRLFHDLEFTSLLGDFLPKAPPDKGKKDYKLLLEESGLADLCGRIARAGAVSLDTETDSPFPTRARLVGMSFALV